MKKKNNSYALAVEKLLKTVQCNNSPTKLLVFYSIKNVRGRVYWPECWFGREVDLFDS